MNSYTATRRSRLRSVPSSSGRFIGLEMVRTWSTAARGDADREAHQVMPRSIRNGVPRRTLHGKHGVRLELNDGVADSSSPRMVRWRSSRVREETSGGHRDPRDWRAPGDRAGEDAGMRSASAAESASTSTCARRTPISSRSRRGRGEGFRYRQWTLIPLAGRQTGRAGSRRTSCRRNSRFRGTQGTSICQIFEAAMPRRAPARSACPSRRQGLREDLPLPEFARGIIGRQDARHQSALPKIRRTPPRGASARRGRCSQTDRFLRHGHPGAADHLHLEEAS